MKYLTSPNNGGMQWTVTMNRTAVQPCYCLAAHYMHTSVSTQHGPLSGQAHQPYHQTVCVQCSNETILRIKIHQLITKTHILAHFSVQIAYLPIERVVSWNVNCVACPGMHGYLLSLYWSGVLSHCGSSLAQSVCPRREEGAGRESGPGQNWTRLRSSRKAAVLGVAPAQPWRPARSVPGSPARRLPCRGETGRC